MHAALSQIEFVGLSGNRVLAILVVNGREVQNRVVQAEPRVDVCEMIWGHVRRLRLLSQVVEDFACFLSATGQPIRLSPNPPHAAEAQNASSQKWKPR